MSESKSSVDSCGLEDVDADVAAAATGWSSSPSKSSNRSPEVAGWFPDVLADFDAAALLTSGIPSCSFTGGGGILSSRALLMDAGWPKISEYSMALVWISKFRSDWNEISSFLSLSMHVAELSLADNFSSAVNA
ncbi:hypothetical protein OGAPHI_006202 [Ogataea philodendri]|uniref:Uncharacterized protein n=1 Tax=Ogataea philodendri TaxID=1378263 RepID=A0A9P8NZB6_9ASCO|nr:uncharacterized protein OGAPHI_006202 [Ogataea philodendri]KAH3662021.1 hypothetical protein OGAPHI_006202 [Ogataea philodendri]